ncbi:transcription factor bHLH49 isoform X1 [Brachypodium distachyon]|uniref:BHLH domain-containing protein n=1 Tax=Brachypodium distachyon TaxID=15368 RepID=A0A0Q3HYZ1_BRADI|nr:transcription factor bHLH49 isoform X1 [Brachypodium distachyon]KQJ98754.1 hypothetical protein BRADI_3g38890v3 [Brachypodium distachyon]|eukprot:XP_014756140.1 transcription factor bHLH49 isoform X1 [Brachypodium distachyon]
MMDGANGDGVGVERSYASSGHSVLPIAWQSFTASSHAAPARRDMDSFAWASVSRRTAAGGSLFPPEHGLQASQAAAGYEHFPADSKKKRRRSDEVSGTDHAKTSNGAEETERGKDAKGEEEAGPAAAAATGQSKGKGAGERQKEGYVHVRARSEQATNSHSIAEKLRREKISERMKLLQDLVPGCSKVTGKAVMLDEIINYVQSLQRQVEFLSMKLSTVNPRLGVDIELLLAKDILPFSWASSTGPMGLSFSQEMMPKPSQPGMLQGDVHGMANPDTLRALMQSFSQEPASQMHLGRPFHGAVQMAYPPLVIGSEDMSIRTDHDGFHI